MQSFNLSTRRRTELVAINESVAKAARALGRLNGAVTVFVPHTTAGVTINENADPDVAADFERAMEQLVPWENHYRHAEGNSAAHVRASLVGASVTAPVMNGCLKLGTWQGIYFCEFDGPRSRTVWVF